MPVPAEILAVVRPKNTVVKKSGDRYLVIKRTCVRKNGKPYPVALGTIGEIVNGEYVQIREKPRKKMSESIDVKDYGEFVLCDKASAGLMQELADVFDIGVAKRLYVLAVMRSAYVDIRNRDIQFTYDTSFASELYPGLALSENTLSSFLERVGMEYRHLNEFMRRRIDRMSGGDIVVDGMLKDNNSDTNSMSEFSRKGARKGSRDINLMYAYDPVSREPIAAKAYPGNMLDMRAVEDFVSTVSIRKGLMIVDKGFFSAETFGNLDEIEGLTYVVPIKRNSSMVRKNGMLDQVCTLLEGYKDAVVFYKKVKVRDGCYLYAYRDPKSAGEQEIGYVMHGKRKGTYKDGALAGKQGELGTIVFQSKSDLDPLVVYEAYARRWEIEVMFSPYKDILDLDTVNVQGDYRLFATEFINFLSTIITSRVRKILDETEVEVGESRKGAKVMKRISDIYSYRQVLRYLSKCKKVRVEDGGKWMDNRRVKYVSNLAKALGICV